MLYRALAANTRGRDFILSDLHGCYDLLLEQLRRVQFNPEVDRLLSVGDLVDRGAYSFQCLQLLLKPWFYAVLGNHEAALLRHLLGARDEARFERYLQEDGAWLSQLTAEQHEQLRDQLVPLLQKLPLVLHVQDHRLAFNVVHAQAAAAEDVFFSDRDLRAVDAVHWTHEFLLWGREVCRSRPFRSAWAQSERVGKMRVAPQAFEPGLSLTYAGHNVVSEPFLYRSHLMLDCGAWARAGLPLRLVEHGQVATSLAGRVDHDQLAQLWDTL